MPEEIDERHVIQDSVVQVSNDAEVVQAALEGAAKIIEQERQKAVQDYIKSQQFHQPSVIQTMPLGQNIGPQSSTDNKWLWIIGISCFSIVIISLAVVIGLSGDSPELIDTDGDGVVDNSDAFPNDPGESRDSDGDGVGDNSDMCPDSQAEADVNSEGCVERENVPALSVMLTVGVVLIAAVVVRR